MALEAGRILSERYRLIRPVGHGSQASVWVAEHLALTTTVAVKLIDPELAKKDSARERFRREATAAAQLRSAHVVQILDHGIDGDQPFIVMELLDGEDLFERLAHRTRLTLRETSKIVTQVARALTRAHAAGIVHRDLKPENIFLVPNDDDEVLKVLDFGVAKVMDPGKAAMQRTGLGTLIGTPHYMSPEQVKGISEIDYRADLWALGVIAYQCVTGDLPFDSEGVGDLLIKISIGDIPVPSKLLPSVPSNFDAWFARACERDPAKRFQSAREMALALAGVVGVVAGEAVKAPTMRPPGGKISLPPGPAAAPRPTAAPAPAKAAPAPAKAAPAAPSPSIKPAPYTPAWARKPAPSEQEIEPIDLESIDEDDEDEAPTRMKPPRESADSTDIDFDIDEPDPPPMPMDPRMSNIGFPLVTRAGAATPPKTPAPPRPAAGAPAAPPPKPPSGPAPGAKVASAPAEEPPPRNTPPAPIAPVITLPTSASAPPSRPAAPSPPRPAMPPPPDRISAPGSAPLAELAVRAQAGDAEPEINRGSDAGAGPASGKGPHSTVSGFARSGLLPTDPPPELDGSRRRRMVRVLFALLLLGAAGVTWGVVRSQFRSPASPEGGDVPPTASTTVEAPPPPPPPPTVTASAATPGHVSRPNKPTPTVKPVGPRPAPKPKKPNDGTIEIPDGPSDDSVPPAP